MDHSSSTTNNAFCFNPQELPADLEQAFKTPASAQPSHQLRELQCRLFPPEERKKLQPISPAKKKRTPSYASRGSDSTFETDGTASLLAGPSELPSGGPNGGIFQPGKGKLPIWKGTDGPVCPSETQAKQSARTFSFGSSQTSFDPSQHQSDQPLNHPRFPSIPLPQSFSFQPQLPNLQPLPNLSFPTIDPEPPTDPANAPPCHTDTVPKRPETFEFQVPYFAAPEGRPKKAPRSLVKRLRAVRMEKAKEVFARAEAMYPELLSDSEDDGDWSDGSEGGVEVVGKDVCVD